MATSCYDSQWHGGWTAWSGSSGWYDRSSGWRANTWDGTTQVSIETITPTPINDHMHRNQEKPENGPNWPQNRSPGMFGIALHSIFKETDSKATWGAFSDLSWPRCMWSFVGVGVIVSVLSRMSVESVLGTSKSASRSAGHSPNAYICVGILCPPWFHLTVGSLFVSARPQNHNMFL
jgi:hypothetical protein